MILQTMGRKDYVQRVTRNISLARKLFLRLRRDSRFEVFTQSLSVTTFRYVPEDLRTRAESAEYLDRLNQALMERVQKSGELYLSNAVIDGRFVLRACITNFRTKEDDIDLAPKIIARLGREVDRSLQGCTRRT
jgi:glutamate/tyrosine decarboxylase-like PLP-dependent enzyme